MALSVIIPFHNSSPEFNRCLEALARSDRAPEEVIAVDDGSTDASIEIARRFDVRIIQLIDGPHGPAVARNRGAEVAAGDILVFLDADVLIHKDTLRRIEEILTNHPEITGLFGSYDEDPPHHGIVSHYKNLQHHYVHHHSQREASSFWAGCGAVRKDVFYRLGGFDESFQRPSVEDIEFGLRMIRSGYRIWLCPEVQVTHLKRWTLTSWLRSDILDRAVPWSRLILTMSEIPADLNLDLKSRMSAMAAWISVGCFLAGFWAPGAWFVALLGMVVLGLLNSGLYRFFQQKVGILFAIQSFYLHFMYYLYSSLTFVMMFAWCWLMDRKGEKFRLSKRMER